MIKNGTAQIPKKKGQQNQPPLDFMKLAQDISPCGSENLLCAP
jgi:hypothetical protein